MANDGHKEMLTLIYIAEDIMGWMDDLLRQAPLMPLGGHKDEVKQFDLPISPATLVRYWKHREQYWNARADLPVRIPLPADRSSQLTTAPAADTPEEVRRLSLAAAAHDDTAAEALEELNGTAPDPEPPQSA